MMVALLAGGMLLTGCGKGTVAKAEDQKVQSRQLIRDGKWGEANTLLQMSVAANPKDAEAQFLLALSFYNLDNYPAAVDHFKAAIDLDPGFMLARLDLGNVYRDMKQWEKAEATYRDLMQRAPDMAQTYLNLARMLEIRGRKADALAALEQGKGKTNSAELLSMLGDYYREAKQIDKARAAYRGALDIDPNYPPAKEALAKLG